MQDYSEIKEFHKRLKPLLHELRPDSGPCPFIVDPEAARRVALEHYSAGRDATYVHVSRKRTDQPAGADFAVIIGYAPAVEGTTIVYDLIEQMMQGKARPFVCNLDRRFIRAYMVLPFQIERIALRAPASADGPLLEVAFLDARGETIQAALPFELRLAGASNETLATEFHATDRLGRCSRKPAEISGATNAVVRSLLTGQETSLTL